MKPIERFLIVFVLFFLAFPTKAQKAKSYKELKYPPLHELKIPEPARYELSNGMVLYLLEDHELPVVNASAIIRTGSRWEPADKIGLASLVGTVMRTGGTVLKSGDELDDELEKIAASVETSIGQTSGSANMSAIKEDVDKVLGVFADVLMHPAFREDKIELAKIQRRDAIARRNDNVFSIISREFPKLIYGATSPYARIIEYEHVDNITKEDLAAFHKKFFAPNNVILGVWGDFNTTEMKGKVENAFKDWQRFQVQVPPVPDVRYDFKNRIFFIQKDDINQTNVRIGHIGGKISDPDYYPLDLMNQVLGGAFSSRLFKNVRSDKGLAYAVFSSWGTNYDYPGVFFVGGETKSQTTMKFIDALLAEVRNIAAKEVADDELRVAREGLLNSFVFNFDSKAKIINRLMVYDYYGYPKDFLFKYKENIEKVTKADILAAAKTRLHPDQLVILAVGRKEDFDEPLSTLGQVTTIDITIPQPKETFPPPTPETIAKGKEILRAVYNGSGGAKLAAVKDLREVGQMAMSTPQGDFSVTSDVTIQFPDKFAQKMITPMGEMTAVSDGKAIWMTTPQGARDVPESQRGEMMAGVVRNSVFLLQNFEKPRFTVQFLKESVEDGKKVNLVLVKDSLTALSMKLTIDAQTNQILKKSYRGRFMGAPSEVDELLSDYRDAGGVVLPFKHTVQQAGKKVVEITVTEIKVNAGVSEKLFVK